MAISMSQASIPAFIRTLTSLSAILDKAAQHAAARKVDPAVLLGTRLFPDMFPLIKQVQLACDFAKGGAARLSGSEPPKFPDEEKTIDDLKARIAKTIDFVKGVKPAEIDGSEDRAIAIPIGGQTYNFKGQGYLVNMVLPNFYFHATTAYAILRHCGVEVGKRDFLGPYRFDMRPTSHLLRAMSGGEIELTILMPCLNEAATVGRCVEKAKGYLARAGITGEILVADNGSTDGSQRLAEAAGARVVAAERRGYGEALQAGIAAARGHYVIMGDADDSYDFSDLDGFVAKLRAGVALVMGNRFAGGITPGAMPFLNRYLGNPVLSFIGALFFHSALRGFQLRPAWLRSPVDRRPQPEHARHGVCLRDGGAGCGQPGFRSPKCPSPSIPTGAAGRRICAPGATAGGISNSCSCTARAGSTSIPAWRWRVVGWVP